MNFQKKPARVQAMKGLAEEHHPGMQNPISLGFSKIDAILGGGLSRGAIHEIFAAKTTHIGAAIGFAAALAVRTAGTNPILWVRHEYLDIETGALSASGLSEIGLDPERLILVRARDVESVLQAGEQAARCSALGAVVLQPWGNPKILNFTASRRLSLASAKSHVPVLMLRETLSQTQSAASTRWRVQAALSRALEANAPGYPAFDLTLLRHRGGMADLQWFVEWDRDRKSFQDRKNSCTAPLSRSVVSVSHDGPAASGARQIELRKAG